MSGPSSSTTPSADAIQREVLAQVQAELRARLVALDTGGDFADPRVFDGVYRRLREAVRPRAFPHTAGAGPLAPRSGAFVLDPAASGAFR